MMLAICLVHRVERPRYPSDAALDCGKPDLRISLEHAGAAQARDRLDSWRKRMRYVIDDRAAFLARYAWIASGGDVECNRKIAVFDRRPHRIVDGQVVIGIARVVAAKDRLARQRQEPESDFRHPLDFFDRQRNLGRHDGRRRRHEVVVLAVHLPREVVPDAALSHPERRILGSEHHQALVRENDLRIDAVADLILNSLFRICSHAAAPAILAILAWNVADHARANARFADTLGDEPLLTFGIDFDVRQTVAKLQIDPIAPQIAGLVGVAVRRDHQVLVRVPGSGSAWPSLMPGGLDPIAILLINFVMSLLHG